MREQTRNLCLLLGKVVIFVYVPAMPNRRWLRVSAIFDTQHVKVIGVHAECDDTLYDHALEAEFAGVIEAGADPITCRRAALSVQRGELWFPRGYLSRRTRSSVSIISPSGLSLREEEILALLAGGITNQDIAEKLFLSRETVRWHLRSIYTKLGVSDRAAAYRLARNQIASSSHELQDVSA